MVEEPTNSTVYVIKRCNDELSAQVHPCSSQEITTANTSTENRVAVRLRPYATLYTPPKHVNQESDLGPGLLHQTSASVPW